MAPRQKMILITYLKPTTNQNQKGATKAPQPIGDLKHHCPTWQDKDLHVPEGLCIRLFSIEKHITLKPKVEVFFVETSEIQEFGNGHGGNPPLFEREL